jgi:two-component system nitrogen regulation sensor histidine kinase NtrY
LARSQKESAWREVAQQVAHEIKNPLTPMKLTLQKLERSIELKDKESRQYATAVKNLLNQLQMLNDIVTSFSEFAKMPIPKNVKMNLADVLKELMALFDSEEHIDLKLQLHTDTVYITADRKLMSRIISNVIINAGQSRKEGQDVVEVVITTELVLANNAVQITIEDNGTGIEKDVIERVFIPRFSTKKEGSGIGLAVAKHGIEHAGGTIWFETEWGKGTIFYLQLPETL